MTSSTRLSD
ncbi:hypothetical protein VTL71DRAFT_9428 [Oculimacula yallundae]|uniref:Uncharacterized protein n=1 Tax=Oculimacula yallundae TaxID=86028 RepID=A0ABR4BU90_9HELO